MTQLRPASVGLASLALTFLTATVAIPQSPLWSTTKDIAIPAGSGYQRLLAGDFLGDQRRHVVVLDSSELRLAFAPAAHDAVSNVLQAQSSTGMTKIAGTHGVRKDRVLITGAGQPRLLEGSLDGSFSVMSTLSLNWEHATKLVAYLDAAQDLSIIGGISDDGAHVLLATQQGLVPPIERAPIHVGEWIEEVLFLDWDGSGTIDVVARTATGLAPYNLDGRAMSRIATPFLRAAAALLPNPLLGDRMVVAGDFGGPSQLFVANGMSVSPGVLIQTSVLGVSGSINVNGIEVRDANGDQSPDLLLSQESTHGSMVLLSDANNPANPFGSSLQFGVVTSTAGDPTVDRCRAIWEDLDQDGGLEVISALDSTDALSIAFDTASAGTGAAIVDRLSNSVISNAAYSGTELLLEIPVDSTTGYDELQYVLWTQANPFTASDVPLDTMAERHEIYPLSHASLAQDGPFWWGADNDDNYVLSIPLNPSSGSVHWTHQRHYYVELRFRNDVTGKVGPSESLALTMGGDEEDIAEGDLPVSTFATNDPNFSYVMTLEGLDDGTTPVVGISGVTRPELVGVIVVRRYLPPVAPGGGPPNQGPATEH